MSKHVECNLCHMLISTYWRNGGGHVRVRKSRLVLVSFLRTEIEDMDFHNDCWNELLLAVTPGPVELKEGEA